MTAPTESEMLEGLHKSVSEIEGDRPTADPLNRSKPKHLRSILDRIVRLEEENKSNSKDIKDIYTEAKSAGFTKGAVRILVKEEMEDKEKRAKREAIEEEADLMRASLKESLTTH